jgi:hypothetical protein
MNPARVKALGAHSRGTHATHAFQKGVKRICEKPTAVVVQR